MKRLETYNFSNLELYQAIEHIVKNENLNTDEKYQFDISVKEGFFNVVLAIDTDGVWAYNIVEIVFDAKDGKPHLVAITNYNEDGSISRKFEIMSEMSFYELKGIAACNDIETNFEVEDVLAGW